MQNKWKSNTSSQGNQFVKIEGFRPFVDNWEFFLSGFSDQVERANMHDLTVDELFKSLLELAVYTTKGFIGILSNKNFVPLGYIAAHDTSISFRPPELTVFLLYSNGKCPSTEKELMYELKKWARERDFVTIRARTFKTSGSAVRFFTNTLRMKQVGVVFQAEL